MVAQALLATQGEPERFARSLAWRLRWWLAGLPAGTGLATLKATLRLWLGYSWRTSGVYSAGNGPAMRAGLLGIFAGSDDDLCKQLVHQGTRMTHTDPMAEQGALLIALAARHAAWRQSAQIADFMREARKEVSNAPLLGALATVETALRHKSSATQLADELGLNRGVSGYVLHTVPVCLFCWLRYPHDFREAIEAVVRLGGDTDTTAAITGGLLGAALGASAIPEEWLNDICEWPRSTAWMSMVAQRLTTMINEGTSPGPETLFWPAILPRNLLFLCAILVHGLRRMLPPY